MMQKLITPFLLACVFLTACSSPDAGKKKSDPEYVIAAEDNRDAIINVAVYLKDTTNIRAVNEELKNKYNTSGKHFTAYYFDDQNLAKLYIEDMPKSDISDETRSQFKQHMIANYWHNPSTGYDRLTVGVEITKPEEKILAKKPATSTIFDVPKMFGKTIDELRVQIGKPQENPADPSAEDLEGLSMRTWVNEFNKNGYLLSIMYNVDTRKVEDFFIRSNGANGISSKYDDLFVEGNVKQNASGYTVEPVRNADNESKFNGIKITPK